MPDETSLDVPPAVEIQLQVNNSRLYSVMAQMIFDVRDGMATIEHINCT